MKKYMCIALAAVFGIAALSAADFSATIKEVAGKVEYQLPGQSWKKAEPGATITLGTIISTGFKSTAVLAVESAAITVKPVTRLTLQELVKSESTTQTQMFLMTGRVKVEVSPQKGEKADFKIKSPTATASVRGTGFEFDGQNLVVEHGAVALESDSGTAYLISAGEFSTVNELGAVPPVAAASGSLDTAAESINNMQTDNFLTSTAPAAAAAAAGNELQHLLHTADADTITPISISVGWDD